MLNDEAQDDAEEKEGASPTLTENEIRSMIADDKDIVRTIKKDVEHGFRMLLAKYQEPVYWHIRRLVVVHADAQDATQETFLRVYRSFNQYSDKNSFRAWIFRIATNEALRLLGKLKGKATLSIEDVTGDMLSTNDDVYFNDEEALVAKLQKAILQLPAKQQLAFNLRYYDEFSYNEIAMVTGSSVESMKTNYHLAKEKIIKYMNSND